MNDLKITDVRVQKGDSAFLIDDGETAILYDTGFGFTGYGVAENIRAVLGERKLDYIFLTHSHYDHALGSAYILRRYPDAKVAAGAYYKQLALRLSYRRSCRYSVYQSKLSFGSVDSQYNLAFGRQSSDSTRNCGLYNPYGY